MFKDAYAIARQFTQPVIVSMRTVGGECRAGPAAFVVLNKDGWIVTAYHILRDCMALAASERDVADRLRAIEATRADPSLSAKEKKHKLRSLLHPKAEEIQNFSVWWGQNGAQLKDVTAIQSVDLAIGRLEPFDPSVVGAYPVLKDPTKDFEPGRSLCKLGFPFHNLPVGWDTASNGFNLGTVALTLFPIEGMLTRFINDPEWVAERAKNAIPFPLQHLEVSSPGLRGQSGGPIFDAQGRVWAIQSATAHLALGFDPEVKAKDGKKYREHQFLNVGRGVHASTIVGLLNQLGIKFELSKD